MALVKSPGGSIFPYFYKNGELHCLKYGSFYEYEEALVQLMKKEEEFRDRGNGFSFAIRHYSDPEEAKTWLVGE
jgi:hypothetical protein